MWHDTFCGQKVGVLRKKWREVVDDFQFIMYFRKRRSHSRPAAMGTNR